MNRNIYIYFVSKFAKENITKFILWKYARLNFELPHKSPNDYEKLLLFEDREELFKTVMVNEQNIPKTYISLNQEQRKLELKDLSKKFIQTNNTLMHRLCEEYKYTKNKIVQKIYNELKKEISPSKELCNYYKSIYNVFMHGLFTNMKVVKRVKFSDIILDQTYETFDDLNKSHNIIIIGRNFGVKSKFYIDENYNEIIFPSKEYEIKVYTNPSNHLSLFLLRVNENMYEVLGNKFNNKYIFDAKYSDMSDNYIVNKFIGTNYAPPNRFKKNDINIHKHHLMTDTELIKQIKSIRKIEIGEKIEDYLNNEYGKLKQFCFNKYNLSALMKKMFNRKFNRQVERLSGMFRRQIMTMNTHKPNWEKEAFENIYNNEFEELSEKFAIQGK